MKKLLALIFIIIGISLNFANAQFADDELTVFNYTSHSITVQLYPVSMVFNKKEVYSMVAEWRKTTSNQFNPQEFYYINGTAYGGVYSSVYEFILGPFQYPHPTRVGWNNEGGTGGNVGSCYGAYGTGQYKLLIRHFDASDENIDNAALLGLDSCIIEFDYIWGNPSLYASNDLGIKVNGLHSIKYYFVSHPEFEIDHDNYFIKSWEPEGPGGSGARAKQYFDFHLQI